MENLKPNNSSDDAARDQKLWSYIDGTLPPAETSIIEKLIQENQQWKQQYAQLLELQQLLQESELEQPPLRFTANVMDEIAKFKIAPAAKTYLNKNIIRGIAAFFALMFAGIIVLALASPASGGGASSGTTEKYINAVDWSQFLSSNTLMGGIVINVILAIFLLDRFLESKRKKLMHK